ncbi:bacteriocin-like protein [Chryseobacterium sp. MYb328]
MKNFKKLSREEQKYSLLLTLSFTV